MFVVIGSNVSTLKGSRPRHTHTQTHTHTHTVVRPRTTTKGMTH